MDVRESAVTILMGNLISSQQRAGILGEVLVPHVHCAVGWIVVGFKVSLGGEGEHLLVVWAESYGVFLIFSFFIVRIIVTRP